MKTIRNLFKRDKEEFNIPKSIQDTIPVNRIWKDGIFLLGKDKYSKTYRFTDINYAVASRNDKEAMFLNYSELLNSLDSSATSKITILNRRLNKVDFEKNILLPKANDNLDKYRDEYNRMLIEQATNSNSMVQEKFLTISINKNNKLYINNSDEPYSNIIGSALFPNIDIIASIMFKYNIPTV